MPSLANSPLRLFQRLFDPKTPLKPDEHAVNTVIDGATAVAITETCIADVAALNASFPVEAATITWKAEQARKGVNCFDIPLASHGTESPRGSLAAAMGLTMSGVRATVFLSGPDLITGQDLLVMAAGRHLPLVVHLSNRTLAAQAGALGTGHEAYQIAADSGCFTLLATNVQEAVDLTLIARRTAELSLIPGIVAMDGEQTALAVQNVSLPSSSLIHTFLGPAHERIQAPTPAQRVIFGGARRRVPCWHDLDRPILHGALQGPESWGLSAVAKYPYFDRHVAGIMNESFSLLAQHTGRHLTPISTHWVQNAEIVLVTQGSTTETVQAVADYMRKRGMKIGVIGIRCLRPFPGPQIAEALRGKRIVGVLERSDTRLADPPLTRQLRAAIDRALENSQFGHQTHPHYPTIANHEQPRLRSVLFGLGGLPLQGADLVALCEELAHNIEKTKSERWYKTSFRSTPREDNTNDKEVERVRSRIYLGFDFLRTSSVYPKRQVLLDILRRDYPEISGFGLRGQDPPPDLRPKGTLTLAIHRIPGQGAEGLAIEAAEFLQQLFKGEVRSDPGLYWERFQSYCVDRINVGPPPLRDPGSQVPVDMSIITTPRHHLFMRPTSDLIEKGILMTESPLDGEILWNSLPSILREQIRIKQAILYRVPPPSSGTGLELSKERLLGALLGALSDVGKLSFTTERLTEIRGDILQSLPHTEREVRLAAFAGGIEGIHRVDYSPFESQKELEERAIWSDEIPTAVRQLGKSDETYDSLPRFWHQVGVMYQNGEAHELTPDPHLATGIIPPLTSTFRDLSGSREFLPAFNPAACTGCGDCWAYCPDSSIGPLVIGTRRLIDIGIRKIQSRELRPIAIRMGNEFHRICANQNNTLDTVAEPLRQIQIPSGPGKTDSQNGEGKNNYKEAIEKLIAEIGSIPIARTTRFFTEPEQKKEGSGELLSIAINPNTCKACGICIDACEPDALVVSQTQERVTEARGLWQIWEYLPETAPETIARVNRDPLFNPMASLLLSRQYLLTMAGGDGAEAGSGEKIAVRHLLSTVEAHQQPLVEQFLADLEQARKDISALIQNTLTDALPTHDLDALATGLASVHPGQVPLTVLTEHLEIAEDTGIVDTEKLRRLVELTRSLGDLHWEIINGRHGLGRARFGLAVGPGSLATWAGAYPNNPFHVPVAIDMTGETAQLVAGLFQGQLRKTTEGIRLLREAYNELDPAAGRPTFTRNRTGVNIGDSNRPLLWQDLTPKERQLCPPVILLGNNEMLGGRGLAAILWLLRSNSPFKILIVSELDLGLDAVVTATDTAGITVDAPFALAKTPGINIGLLALAQYRAYVAQTSIAHPEHFLTSVRAAMDYSGPALLHIHAPSPERHGFPMHDTVKRARDAVRARVFPLFRYDPRVQGVFGLRIDLTGNPDPNLVWTTSDGEPFTPVHWALEEGRFAERFPPISEEDTDTIETLPLVEYLELDRKTQSNKIPTIHRASPGGEQVLCRINSDLVTATRDRRETWSILQELAGLVTPFTEEIEKRVEQRAATLREAEHHTLKKEHKAEVIGLRGTMEAEIANRIHERLMQLAGLKAEDEI